MPDSIAGGAAFASPAIALYIKNPARGKSGAGLGLSIVRELMEQMGGRVSAQAAENTLHIKLRFSTDGEE